jgi:hypothetical protein
MWFVFDIGLTLNNSWVDSELSRADNEVLSKVILEYDSKNSAL